MSILTRVKDWWTTGRASSRSLEDPTVSLHDPEAWNEIFDDGSSSEAGINVSLRTAVTVSAIWRGINLIANTVAKLPCHVIDNELNRHPEHPASKLINRRACPEISAFHFQQTMTAVAILRGNAYAWVHRVNGVPVELVPLNHESTYPMRRDGELFYVTTIAGKLEVLFPSEVIHIHGLGFDGLMGQPIIKLACDDIGSEIAHRKLDAGYFKNPTPPYTLETPEALSDTAFARLTADWHKVKPGIKNANKPAILEEGLKANPLILKPSELQAIEQKKFRLTSFANWLQLPPHKLGAEGKSAYASLEQENQSLRDDTYDPHLVVHEDEYAEKLLTTEENDRGTRFIAYDRDALDRVNTESRAKFFQAALAGGPFLTVNEVRRKAGEKPIKGGDELVWPGNIAPPNLNAPSDPSPPDADTKSRSKRRRR